LVGSRGTTSQEDLVLQAVRSSAGRRRPSLRLQRGELERHQNTLRFELPRGAASCRWRRRADPRLRRVDLNTKLLNFLARTISRCTSTTTTATGLVRTCPASSTSPATSLAGRPLHMDHEARFARLFLVRVDPREHGAGLKYYKGRGLRRSLR